MSGWSYDYSFTRINDLIDMLEMKNKQAKLDILFHEKIEIWQIITSEFYESFQNKYITEDNLEIWYNEIPFKTQIEKDEYLDYMKKLYNHRDFLIKILTISSDYSKEIEWIDSGDSSELTEVDNLQIQFNKLITQKNQNIVDDYFIK